MLAFSYRSRLSAEDSFYAVSDIRIRYIVSINRPGFCSASAKHEAVTTLFFDYSRIGAACQRRYFFWYNCSSLSRLLLEPERASSTLRSVRTKFGLVLRNRREAVGICKSSLADALVADAGWFIFKLSRSRQYL